MFVMFANIMFRISLYTPPYIPSKTIGHNAPLATARTATARLFFKRQPKAFSSDSRLCAARVRTGWLDALASHGPTQSSTPPQGPKRRANRNQVLLCNAYRQNYLNQQKLSHLVCADHRRCHLNGYQHELDFIIIEHLLLQALEI